MLIGLIMNILCNNKLLICFMRKHILSFPDELKMNIDDINIDLNMKLRFNNFITHYDSLSDEIKLKLEECKSELKNDNNKKICDDIYGNNKCKSLNPFTNIKKCEEGYNNLGPMLCYKKCSNNFETDNIFYCNKKVSYFTPIYLDKCEDNITGCLNFRNLFYVKDCNSNYELIGNNICLHKCENNMMDLGSECGKVSFSLLPTKFFISY